MKTINSWTNSKQADKIEINIRISKLTILEIDIDFSRKEYKLMIFNFGIAKTTPTKKTKKSK